jgi:hypothetical protein
MAHWGCPAVKRTYLMYFYYCLEVEMAAQELRRHTSPGINQTTPEMITVRGRKFRCEIRNFTEISRNRLSSGRSR